ncbi:MAG TPA: MBL fold metallo-hydrolase [Candidatus Korarchaeota archaeon]|nr:MBL fold metallo-hydrolase [Candidatus Korarchaeota archaeon]
MELKKLGKGALLAPGSPGTLILSFEAEVWIVDPGSRPQRGEELARRLGKGKRVQILITHSHSDHLAAIPKLVEFTGAKVICPSLESCSARNAEIRKAMGFGAKRSERLTKVAPALSVKVDEIFDPPCRLGSLEAVPLPGHSFGHVGYLTEDGLLYAGDAFFGDKLLRSVVIPYFIDYETSLETIRTLLEEARDYRKIVPSHGPVCEGKKAEDMLKANLNALENLPKKVMKFLERGPVSAEGLTARVLLEAGANIGVSSLLISSVTIKSLLSYMLDMGEVEPIATESGILWKIR